MRDHNGSWIHGVIGYLGEKDILFAKLYGIKTTLLFAWHLNFKEGTLESNSKEARRQVMVDHYDFHIYRAILVDIKSLIKREWNVVILLN